MKRVAILVEDLYQDQEVWYPYYRLKEAGVQYELVIDRVELSSKFTACYFIRCWAPANIRHAFAAARHDRCPVKDE